MPHITSIEMGLKQANRILKSGTLLTKCQQYLNILLLYIQLLH
jgi:hypothetical protein